MREIDRRRKRNGTYWKANSTITNAAEEKILKTVVISRRNASAIDNLLQAIEQGETAASAMKCLRELESLQNDLEEQIAIEKGKSEIPLTKFQIRQFYEENLRNTPKMPINALVRKIILFDNKI